MSKKNISKEVLRASIVIGAFFFLFFGYSFIWASLDLEEEKHYSSSLMKIPAGFPVPEIPPDNFPNKARIELGKRLFFDTITSRTKKLGCFSCHLPHKAMGDTGRISFGVEGKRGFRNTPTIANIAYHPIFMKDGGVPTLEMQLLVPISDTAELDFNIVHIGDRMQLDPTYGQSALDTYDKDSSYYAFVVSRSISCFQRTLISGNSRFDKFYYQGNEKALSASEKRGLNLFMSDSLNCSKCHTGFNFTNNTFQNNGLYLNYKDKGRGRITMEKTDEGKFKVPTLRNVEISGPYMHDGSIRSLEEVIEHYAIGGVNNLNKSELIRGFRLSNLEKEDLLAFLKSLTDNEFKNNPF